MYQDTTPRFWYLLGLGTGCVYSLFAVVAYYAGRGRIDFPWLYEKAKDWQTLIAGIIAFVGAYLTVVALRAQDEDRRERKQYADRTALPTALVALDEYLRGSLTILTSLRAGLCDSRIRFSSDWSPPKLPDYPYAAVDVVRSCLETTERQNRQPLRHILQQLQVQNSRLKSIVRDVLPDSTMIVVEDNLSDYIVHTLDLIVRCQESIPYARGDLPEPRDKPWRGAMGTKAFFADIHEEDYPLVFEKIVRRYAEEPGSALKG